MRQIDDMTPQEIEVLALKGMTIERNCWNINARSKELHDSLPDNAENTFDVRREHEHDLEEESRRDYETWNVDEENCPECERSNGSHFTGTCEHGDAHDAP